MAFDLQQYLTDMEDRINKRFDKVDEIAVSTARHDERLKTLEETRTWALYGFWSGFLGMCGVIAALIKHVFYSPRP